MLDNAGRELRIKNYLVKLEFLRYQRNENAAWVFEQTIKLLSLIEADETELVKKISSFNQFGSLPSGSTRIWAKVSAHRYKKKGVPIILSHEFYHYRPATKNKARTRKYLGSKTAWRRIFQSCYPDALADSLYDQRKAIVALDKERKKKEKALESILEVVAQFPAPPPGVMPMKGSIPKEKLAHAAYMRRIWVENLSSKILNIRVLNCTEY
ncbi:MAG: hypothetical protein RPU39_04005 [Candidatus Sedimenticola sp. (ex Thyasira tokunagai)]